MDLDGSKIDGNIDMRGLSVNVAQLTMMYAQAVSLKRIADLLEHISTQKKAPHISEAA